MAKTINFAILCCRLKTVRIKEILYADVSEHSVPNSWPGTYESVSLYDNARNGIFQNVSHMLPLDLTERLLTEFLYASKCIILCFIIILTGVNGKMHIISN
jgi:hypothetical protein